MNSVSLVFLLLLLLVYFDNNVSFRYHGRLSSSNWNKVSSSLFSTSTSSSPSSSSIINEKELNDMFWITPEGLSIEIIAAYSQIAGGSIDKLRRVDDRSELRKWWENTKLLFDNKNKLKLEWSKAPILFIHGSYHAAWCYAEHYLDYFSSLGHNCYAISLRGTSGTGMPPTDPGDIVRIEKHVYDIQCALQKIREDDDSAPNPIIISHSFGGLITMKLLEIDEVRKNLTGVALLCSVPPSGNGPMTQRFVQSRFLNSLKIVWGFVFKAATTNIDLCRELFFDDSFNASDIKRYMRNFQSDSRVGLDLQALAPVLPSVNSINGKAPWLINNDIELDKATIAVKTKVENNSTDINLLTPSTPFTELELNNVLSQYDEKNLTKVTKAKQASAIEKKIRKSTPNVKYTKIKSSIIKTEDNKLARLVVGAGNDFIVDDEGVKETAFYLGVEPVFIKDLYHDVMLGPKWKESADVIKNWLDSI